MTIGDRIDSAVDKTKGKTNQAVGEFTGDKDQKARGHAQELKGDLRDIKTDVKDALKDD